MTLFSTGLTGLNLARTALTTTAHNVANVYTPGYSRQKAVFASAGGIGTAQGFLGMGAKVLTVARSYDDFLNAQLTHADSATQDLDTMSAQMGRLDNLLADRESGLSALLQTFFAGVQGVADTPADPAARQQMISSAQALAGKFQSTDRYLTDLNASVNDQVGGAVQQINAYTAQIASLNHQIGQLEGVSGGQAANDLLDTRDQLVSDLSKLVGVTVVKQDNGQYNLSIGVGQTLVLGDRAATVSAVASAADPTRTAMALSTTSGTAVELSDSVVTGGTLGGLLTFRSQALIPTQNSIGRLAVTMADAINAQHRTGVDMKGASGLDFFSFAGASVFSNGHNTANGLVLQASISDAKALTTSDYRIEMTGVAGAAFSVTRLSDGQKVAVSPAGAALGAFNSFPISFDGVSVAAVSGAAKVGDSFLVQPTRNGARDLAVQVTDPALVAAAASPVIASAGAANGGSGSIAPARTDSTYRAAPLAGPVTLTYDAASGTLSGFPPASTVTVVTPAGAAATYAAPATVPYTAGASISFGGISAVISGAPTQGDTFTIAAQLSGVSDGSNALKLGGLQRQNSVAGATATLNGAYAALVSEVGNQALEVKVALESQQSLADQVRMSQQSVSGVNQDEEASNLLQFQQMYQANAKVIQTAGAIFDAILGIS
jgi:flagellar hook-associated protein 1